MSQRENADAQQTERGDSIITVVLLGINSSDKCLIGNTILNHDCFSPGKDKCESALGAIADQMVFIINTPDLFHKSRSDPESDRTEQIKPSYAGPRMFLLVLQDKHLSQEEMDMFNLLKERFGKKMVENTIIVLVNSEGQESANGIDKAVENLKKLMDECGRRVFVHNKKQKTNPELIKQLIEKSKRMQENQAHESSRLVSNKECLYEVIGNSQLMMTKPEASQLPENRKGENIQPFKGDCMITVVLLGKNSNEKSLIGNSICGNQCFQSVIVKCERVVGKVADQRVCIINTPDLFHKSRSDSETESIEEIKPSYAGPRMFLLVLQDKHLSQEEMDMFNQLKERFGKKMVENTIIVLVNSEGQGSANGIDKADENLKKLLNECEKRVCVHSKKQKMNPELIKQLIEKSKRMQENQELESSRLVSVEEGVYEEIDCSKHMPENPKVSEHHKGENVQTPGVVHTITLILLGSRKYKCLIGNAILGKQCFQLEKNTYKKVVETVSGERVCIINTPDHYPTPSTNPAADSIEELKPPYPGPRVFLLVLQDEKISETKMEMFKKLKEIFGQKMVENTIIVRVKGDEKLYARSIDRFDSFKKANFKTVQEECGYRVCIYCTKDMKNIDLITQLKELWDRRYQKSDNERTELILHADNSVEPRKQNPAGPQQIAAFNFINIVLLGQTGSGKSATGNTILGRSHFESYASSVPVTNVCQRAEAKVGKLRIRVIDTPDFFNEDLKNQADQMKMCKELTQQGPVVYLLVMHLGRFTEGEREVLPQLKREFGEDITEKTVILFTGKEKLKEKTLKDYINETDPELQKLIHTCHARCHAFNNNDKNSHQVKKLTDLILEMPNIPIAKHDHYHMKFEENKDCRVL